MELHLKKNAAAEIMFAMVDSTTPASLKSGVSPVDTPYSRDGAGAWTTLAITDAATEIGTTGMYTIELTAAEMNHDLIMIKMAVAGAADTVIIIRTFGADIDDVKTDTAAIFLVDTADIVPLVNDSHTILIEIGSTGMGLTALGDTRIANLDAAISTRATPTQVNTEVDTALSDVNLDHLVGTAAAIPAIPAGTYIDQMMDDGTAVYNRTTDSLQAIRDRGDAAWITATGFATAVVCTEARLAELDAANLITDVANVKTDTAAILLDTGTDGVVVATGSKTGYALSTAGVDAILDDVIEGALTMRQALRLFLSALAGKSTGGGTVTLTFRDNADAKARITATVDANGNRTAMTLDGT